MKERDNTPLYVNHCWNCGKGIDSNSCERSPIPGAGYICNKCGYDLHGYRRGDWRKRQSDACLNALLTKFDPEPISESNDSNAFPEDIVERMCKDVLNSDQDDWDEFKEQDEPDYDYEPSRGPDYDQEAWRNEFQDVLAEEQNRTDRSSGFLDADPVLEEEFDSEPPEDWEDYDPDFDVPPGYMDDSPEDVNSDNWREFYTGG